MTEVHLVYLCQCAEGVLFWQVTLCSLISGDKTSVSVLLCVFVRLTSSRHDGVDSEAPAPAVDGAIAGELPFEFVSGDP